MSIKVPMAGQLPSIRGGGGVLARDGASAMTAIRERLRSEADIDLSTWDIEIPPEWSIRNAAAARRGPGLRLLDQIT